LVELSPPRIPTPDWSAVLAVAGLDPALFHPAPPRWSSPFDADAHVAWEGSLPRDPKTPIRVEAASYRGRLVYFELLGPWSHPERMQERAKSIGQKVGFGMFFSTVIAALVIGGVLARRNLRLGRGDKAGALRVSLVVFALLILQWLFSGHMVVDPGELDLIVGSVSRSCFWALLFGVMYLALEPYVRRRWPDVLISWNRIVAGRFRDPLVGRDLLIGVVAGAFVAVAIQLSQALPAWFDVSGMTPQPPKEMALSGIGGLLSSVIDSQVYAVMFGVVQLFVILLVGFVVRRRGAAVAVGGFLLLLFRFPTENIPVELPFAVLTTIVVVGTLFRFGLLSLVTVGFVNELLTRQPLTLDPSRWYFGYGMLAVAITMGLLVYGFHGSLGGQKAFGALPLDD
jgi:serine/threonine-protein kinase